MKSEVIVRVDIALSVVITEVIVCVDCIAVEKVVAVPGVIKSVVEVGVMVWRVGVGAVAGTENVDDTTDVMNGKVVSVVDITVAESVVESTVVESADTDTVFDVV